MVTRTHPLGDDSVRTLSDGRLSLIVWLDLAAKLTLLGFLTLVLLDPGWGNLEGKAPVARAITYPLWALSVPVVWFVWLRHRGTAYPWLPDLLVTLVCFSDILGNRLDLYDSVVWFDDWMHLLNSALISAAVILLTLPPGARLSEILERSIAFGVTASLVWELFEYLAFVTHSPELPTAYADTLGDLLLGWCGAVVAGLVIAVSWRTSRGLRHRSRSMMER